MGWGSGNLGGVGGTGRGDGSLNLEVICSVNMPLAPKENTFWLDTNIKSNRYFISEEVPAEPKPGDTWIHTVDPVVYEGVVAKLNVAKKNEMYIYPLNAVQYINGAWVSKPTEVFYNGRWHSLKYLYVCSGVICDSSLFSKIEYIYGAGMTEQITPSGRVYKSAGLGQMYLTTNPRTETTKMDKFKVVYLDVSINTLPGRDFEVLVYIGNSEGVTSEYMNGGRPSLPGGRRLTRVSWGRLTDVTTYVELFSQHSEYFESIKISNIWFE